MQQIELYCEQKAFRGRFVRHPLVQNLPILPKESADYKRIKESIAGEGIREPLKCVANNDTLLVLDGLHRLAIADELEIKELPYQNIETKELLAFVCASVVRTGWTKSALAYRMWPLFAALAHKSQGRPKLGNDFPILSCEEIAVKIGVSKKLVDQAKRAHQFFSKHPKKREELEPLILTNLIPLHRVGPEGRSSRSSPSPITAIESRIRRLSEPFVAWEQLDADAQLHATNLVAEAVRNLPKAVQMATLETLEVAWRS